MIYGGHFDIESKKEEIKDLEKETLNQDFWNNHIRAEETLKNITELKNLVSQVSNLKTQIEDNLELLEIVDSKDIEENILENNQELEKLNLLLLLNGPYDKKDCILEIFYNFSLGDKILYILLTFIKLRILLLLLPSSELFDSHIDI